jgi:hypothetical protein
MGNLLIDTGRLIRETVTYNSEHTPLYAQLRALPAGSLKIIVDNGSAAACVEALTGLKARIPNLHLVFNQDNLGLAAALNQGVRLGHNLEQTNLTWKSQLNVPGSTVPEWAGKALSTERRSQARNGSPCR